MQPKETVPKENWYMQQMLCFHISTTTSTKCVIMSPECGFYRVSPNNTKHPDFVDFAFCVLKTHFRQNCVFAFCVLPNIGNRNTISNSKYFNLTPICDTITVRFFNIKL